MTLTTMSPSLTFTTMPLTLTTMTFAPTTFLTAPADGLVDQPLIKILLLAGIVVVTAMLTRSTAGASHQAIRRLMLVAFVVLAAAAILFPRLLTQAAQLLGVGRGADLLLYGLTVVFLGYVAASYRRMRQMEQQVTTLARELALREAKGQDPGPRSPDAQP